MPFIKAETMKICLAILSIVLVLVAGHSGVMDDEKRLSNASRDELRAVIYKWTYRGATLSDRSRTVEKLGNSRIDLQGLDSRPKGRAAIIHRYAVQQGKGTYAVVHMESAQEFSLILIRAAFLASKKHRAHVFLTRGDYPIDKPEDGKQYLKGEIKHKANGVHKTYVWSTKPVVDELVRRFNNNKLKVR